MIVTLFKYTKPTRYQHVIDLLTCTALLGFILLLECSWLGLRFNRTHSVPMGFYWAISKNPNKGDYVSFCPAETPVIRQAVERGYLAIGNCPGHVERLLKIVVAMAGDNVSIQPDGVRINGQLLPNSQVLNRDGLGRPLAPFALKSIRLQANELWVMTDHNNRSFDSRYFGPIRTEQVSDVVKPLWTWL